MRVLFWHACIWLLPRLRVYVWLVQGFLVFCFRHVGISYFVLCDEELSQALLDCTLGLEDTGFISFVDVSLHLFQCTIFGHITANMSVIQRVQLGLVFDHSPAQLILYSSCKTYI